MAGSGNEHRPLDDAAQFTDIAGPWVALELSDRFLVDGVDRLAERGSTITDPSNSR